jgi:hypothetical protein
MKSGSRAKQLYWKRMKMRAAAVLAAAALLAAAILFFAAGRRDAADSLGPDSPAARAISAQDQARETAAPPLPLYDDPAIQARWTSEGITEFTKQEVRLQPILDYAKDATDKVAITVDDCLQFDNLRAILDLADDYGAKLTFFPIG